MDIKAIAIGNPLMGDDGIALKVAEQLSGSLAKLGVEVIIGETDIDYCISRISENGRLIVIDGSCRGEALGSISSMPLQKAVDSSNANSWQHDRDLIRELKIRGIRPSGLLICIEVRDIDFRWGLSAELQALLPEICEEVYGIILGSVKVLC